MKKTLLLITLLISFNSCLAWCWTYAGVCDTGCVYGSSSLITTDDYTGLGSCSGSASCPTNDIYSLSGSCTYSNKGYYSDPCYKNLGSVTGYYECVAENSCGGSCKNSGAYFPPSCLVVCGFGNKFCCNRCANCWYDSLETDCQRSVSCSAETDGDECVYCGCSWTDTQWTWGLRTPSGRTGYLRGTCEWKNKCPSSGSNAARDAYCDTPDYFCLGTACTEWNGCSCIEGNNYCLNNQACIKAPPITVNEPDYYKTCYTGWTCNRATAICSPSGTKTDLLLTNVISGVCHYSPACTSSGWVLAKNSIIDGVNQVFVNDKLEKCSDLKGDEITSFGDFCDSSSGFFYNTTSENPLCYYDLQCVNCALDPNYLNDNLGYCNNQYIKSSNTLTGGWVGKSVPCLTPGSVGKGPGGMSVCYYSNTGVQDVCLKTGCTANYGLMFGNAFYCDPIEGPVLKVTSLMPPKTILQSMPSLLAFGYQNMATFDSEEASEIVSCSCEAQDVAGGEFCATQGSDYGFYGSQFATIRKSSYDIPGYNPQEGMTYSLEALRSVIHTIECDCLFPDWKLINGTRWDISTFKTTFINRSSVCRRLFQDQDHCYWNYTSFMPESFLTEYHGSELSREEDWCMFAFNGRPCDMRINQLYRLLFNVSTLIDVKINIYNPKRTVPVYLTLYENGEEINSGNPNINSLVNLKDDAELTTNFNINSDFRRMGYEQISLSLFCSGSNLSVQFNDNEPLSFSCAKTGWNIFNISKTISFLNQGSNEMKITSTTGEPVFLGVDNSSPYVWSMTSCSNASPIIEELEGTYSKFFVSGKLITGCDESYCYNVSNRDQKIPALNVKNIEFFANRIYVLDETGFNYSARWTKPQKIDNASPELISAGTNNLYAYENKKLYAINNRSISRYINDEVLWIQAGINGLFVGIKDFGVYSFNNDLTNYRLLTDSKQALNHHFFLTDIEGDSLDDFIGITNSSPRNDLIITKWEGLPSNAFIKKQVTNTSPITELAVGDFSKDTIGEIILRTQSTNLLIKDDEKRDLSITGNSWKVFNNDLYTLINGKLRKYTSFTLSCPTESNALSYSILLKSGDDYSSLDLLYPNIYARPDQVFVSESLNDLQGSGIGGMLYCGRTYYYNITFIQDEEFIHYNDFTYRIKLDDNVIYCNDSYGYFGNESNTITEVIKCKLPECDYGLPRAEEFKLCVKAGDFEQENCRALSMAQLLYGNPSGIRIASVTSNNVALFDAPDGETYPDTFTPSSGLKELIIAGAIIDDNEIYKEITGIKIFNNAGGLEGINNTLIPVNNTNPNAVNFKDYTYFTKISLTPGTYTLVAHALDYYETSTTFTIPSATPTQPTCTSDCSTAGITRCSSNYYQICTQTGSCLNWQNTQVSPIPANACSATGCTGVSCSFVYSSQTIVGTCHSDGRCCGSIGTSTVCNT